MQVRALEHWSRSANTEEEPTSIEDDDFGFNHAIEYVIQTAQIFILSGFVVMPEPGGWNDQDSLWCDDIIVYLQGYRRAQWEASNQKGNSVDERMFQPIGRLK